MNKHPYLCHLLVLSSPTLMMHGHTNPKAYDGIVSACVSSPLCLSSNWHLHGYDDTRNQPAYVFFISFVFLGAIAPQWALASSFTRFVFLHHTQRHTTVGRTPLDELSARRRDIYLTTQSTHNRQTSMPPVGFEPTISAGERP